MTKYQRIDPEISRRRFVNTALGVTAGVAGLGFITILGSAKPVNRLTADKLPPVTGDVLVYAEGDQTGKPVNVTKLEPQPVKAWAMTGSLVKSGEPNYLLVISKFPDGVLKPPTHLQQTASGIVTYSSICTHLGCQVNWKNQNQTYLCPCHSSDYDPKRGAVVIGGPAPRPLPQLPIKIEGTKLVVAGPFDTIPFGVDEAIYKTALQEAQKA